MHHLVCDKNIRHDQLLYHYFECDCRACKNNFPTMNNAASYNLVDVNQTFCLIPPVIDKSFAEEMLKRFNIYMNKYEHLYPCRELMTIIPLYMKFFQLIVGNQSFRLEIEGRFPKK